MMDKRLPHIVSMAQIACRDNPDLKNMLRLTMGEMARLKSDERVKLVYRKIDEEVHKDEQIKDSKCQKGCAHCCYHKIEATKSEIEAIKIQTPTKKLEAVACPLLGKDNLCSVYEVRPIICRLTNVLSKPQNCKSNSNESIEHLPLTKACIWALAYFMLEPELFVLRDNLL